MEKLKEIDDAIGKTVSEYFTCIVISFVVIAVIGTACVICGLVYGSVLFTIIVSLLEK